MMMKTSELIRCGRTCMINLSQIFDINWYENPNGLMSVAVEYPNNIKTYYLDANEFEVFIQELNDMKATNRMKF